MKLKIYLHKSLKTKIDDDIIKMQDYFKSDFFRQFIDDTFLEWFVNNSSCEFLHLGYKPSGKTWHIIIPKEESKQDDTLRKTYPANIEGSAEFFDSCSKQEELEKAAENYAHNYFEPHETNHYKALKQG